MQIEQFELLAKKRFSCRAFDKKPVSEKLMEKLLDTTRMSPSSYNLQPIHYIVVQSEMAKKAVWEACLKQDQILMAPYIVLFAADRRVIDNNAEAIINEEKRSGSFTEEKTKHFRKFLSFGFDTSKWGFQGFIKRLCAPIVRWRATMPTLPLENMDAWLAKQAGLSVMTFVWAAESAGLSTCIMEAFDEKRLRKAVSLDNSWYIPMIVAVGYGNFSGVKTSRLPLSESVTWI